MLVGARAKVGFFALKHLPSLQDVAEDHVIKMTNMRSFVALVGEIYRFSPILTGIDVEDGRGDVVRLLRCPRAVGTAPATC